MPYPETSTLVAGQNGPHEDPGLLTGGKAFPRRLEIRVALRYLGGQIFHHIEKRLPRSLLGTGPGSRPEIIRLFRDEFSRAQVSRCGLDAFNGFFRVHSLKTLHA